LVCLEPSLPHFFSLSVCSQENKFLLFTNLIKKNLSLFFKSHIEIKKNPFDQLFCFYVLAVLGGSTTQLFANAGNALWEFFEPGDHIVLSQLEHEANLCSWVRLAQRKQLEVTWWSDQAPNPMLTAENLQPLLKPNTKFVACTHTSNILGTIHDIAALNETIRSVCPDALFCVDGVAFAPHRAVDVRALGIDIYNFSWYKVYGPHVAILYASDRAKAAMTSLGHYFNNAKDEAAYGAGPESKRMETMLGLASPAYELTQSLVQVVQYIDSMGGSSFWEGVARHEETLQNLVLDFLKKNDRITIFGQPVADLGKRLPVLSFGVKGRSSKEIVQEVEKRSHYGLRWGHFYSHRLCTQVLGLDDEGVVRISLVHYNTGKCRFLLPSRA
jgi:selenocysteine lyase/cysteine desulfurase